MKNLVYIVMDSCRFDSYERARTPNMDRIGKGERRYSYASWTSPSHQTILMGISPHTSQSHVIASEVYKQDFVRWRERLDIPDLEFRSFVPHLWLPKKLRDLGFRTIGRVSLPVLNEFAGFARDFHDYRLMDDHNDFAGMIDEMEFPAAQPMFYFFNLGETHYPYMLTKDEAPVLHGFHGVVKRLDDAEEEAGPGKEFYTVESLRRFHDQQVRCVEYVDTQLGRLLERVPENTHLIVTADHGELFGEDGYFGHGPIFHEKVFEVPFLEGVRP